MNNLLNILVSGYKFNSQQDWKYVFKTFDRDDALIVYPNGTCECSGKGAEAEYAKLKKEGILK